MCTLNRRLLAAIAGLLPLLPACRSNAPERVSILRDDFGVPNIFAETDEGAVFAMGYAQAEDRPLELQKQYRRAAGTMAEAFGPAHLRDDFRQRLWRHEEISRARLGDLSARTRGLIGAYVEGINLYFSRHPERLPSWGQKVEPWMVVALGRYVLWGWPEGTAAEDLERAGIEPDPIEARASNQWMVSGTRTASGAPLALIDPHLSWYGAFRFYEARLYGKALEVAGVSILGSPLPTLGHNRKLSLAMTTGGPDTSDVYELTLDAARPGKYLRDGSWVDFSERTVVIRSLEDGRLVEHPFRIQDSHLGPVVAHRDGKAYVFCIPYAEEVGLLDQTYAMMTSGSIAEMRSALSQLQLMEQNVMVATVSGDLYYVRNGRVPVRPPGFDWSRPVPGSSSVARWKGIHPLGDLVQILNPPQGYLQNCNCSPRGMTLNCPLTPERWGSAPYLYNEEPPLLHPRAAQTLLELSQEPRLTLERAIEIAFSARVFQADLWQAQLARALGEKVGGKDTLSPGAARCGELILQWNRTADVGSPGATAYLFWKEALYGSRMEAPPAARSGKATTWGQVARERDQQGLAPAEPPAEELLAALGGAAERLLQSWGKVEVPYGEVFRARRDGSARSFPLSGGTQTGLWTPRAAKFVPEPDGRTYRAVSGQTATQIVELTDPPRSYSLLPLGQSDDPESPHFDDQAEQLLSKCRLKPTYFLRKDELLPHVRSTLVLEWRRS